MEFLRKHYKLVLWAIPLVSLVLHFHVFNLDLIGIHVWRQTETQTVINNFYRDDMNILNPRFNDHAETNRLHRMEFPVMQWIFALFYKVFGTHIVISRILSFIIGLCSVYGIFYFLQKVSGNKVTATLGAWCFNFSPVFYYYTLNPMPDNMALCCAIWSLGFFYNYTSGGKLRQVIWSGIFLCLATMAKLPFIIYGSFIATFLTVAFFKKSLPVKELLRVAFIYILCLMPAAAWYVAVIPGWVIGAVHGVFNQTLNHPDLFAVLTGTLISVLPELLINYASVVFFVAGFYLLFRNKLYTKAGFIPFFTWGIVVISYFLYEMNIIDLVHDYYLFLFLPPIFLLVAYGAQYMLGDPKVARYGALLCLCALPLTAYLRADSRWDTRDPGFNSAYYKYKDELRSLTPPGALCVAGYDDSHYILLYYIDRKGWAFDKSWFDEQLLSFYISKGARYIFLDENIDDLPGIRSHLGEKIFDKETLRVYKLK